MIRLALAFACVATAASAEPLCGDYETLTAAIGTASKFREQVVINGADTQSSGRIEIWANLETGTFTVLSVTADRLIGCFLAAGNAGGRT